MRNKFMTKTVPVLAALLVAGAAQAEIKTVSVTAEVEAVDGDKQRTEARAKREARRLAVEQGAGTLITSATVVADFEVVSDEITTSAKGVITKEKWGALKINDGVAKISLEAKVRPEAAASAVCQSVKQNHDPKIAAVIVEKRGKEASDWKTERGVIESMIVGRLVENCFTMVEPGVQVTKVSANGDLDQATINQIVENANAKFVLLGAAKAIESDTQGTLLGKTKMKSFAVGANLKLIDVDTNQIIAVSSESMQVLGISPDHALKAKGKDGDARAYGMIEKNLTKIFSAVVEKWSKDAVNASKVEVIVKNVKNFRSMRTLQKTMEKTFPKGNVAKRGLKNKKAVFYVDVDGGADELAAELEGKRIGKLSVEVLEVVRGKVVLQLN
jgi:hypothetical protein